MTAIGLREIRRFRAATAQEAMDAVRAALGTDAVIVESRSVVGVFGPPRIEVTAMTDRPVPHTARDRVTGGDAGPSPAIAVPDADVAGSTAEDVSVFIAAARRLESKIEGLRHGLRNVTRDNVPSPLAWRPGLPEAAPWARIADSLCARGVAPDIARDLAERAHDFSGSAAAGEPEGREESRETLAHLLRKQIACVTPPWRKREGASGPRFVALVGPTGAGKTLSVVKIAARAALEGNLRVGLISLDVHRVGARDQIAGYGRLMGVPVQFAGDAPAFLAITRAMRELDLVVIDTAGTTAAPDRERQWQTLRAAPQLETVLVLPATVSALDAEAQADGFATAGPRLILISKIDEAAGPGAILSALRRLPLPIAALTNGQRIPQDLLAATPAGVVELILGTP